MILKIFLFWRFGLFIVTYLGAITFPKIQNSGIGAASAARPFDFWASWAQWDGGHYFAIAKNGYVMESDYAFFPLYPYLAKIISDVFSLNLIFAGLLLSNIFFVIFLWIFFKLLKEKYSKKLAYIVIVSFLFFPTTFFTVAFYPESLFLLLSASTFYFLLKKNYLTASIFASFASLTRFWGVFLAIAIFYSYLANRNFNYKKIDTKLLHVLPSLFGFAIYGLYLYFTTNDFVKFLSVQVSWQRVIQDPISTILPYLWDMFTVRGRPLNDFLDLASTLLFLILLIWGARKIPSSWWIFSMLVILISASAGTLSSMPRYVLASIGSFVVIGLALSKNSTLRFLVWFLFLISQAILAVLFVNGYWVA